MRTPRAFAQRPEPSLQTENRDRPPLRGDDLFDVHPVGQRRGRGALAEARQPPAVDPQAREVLLELRKPGVERIAGLV